MAIRSGICSLLAATGTACVVLFGGAVAAAECGGEYEVRSGDNVSKIASRCAISVKDLMAANPSLTNAGRIYVGQKLAMPGIVNAALTAPQTTAGDALVLRGLIRTGRSCALLETDDGMVYGLTGPSQIFWSGHTVKVTGEFRTDRRCGGTKTLLVRDLETITE